MKYAYQYNENKKYCGKFLFEDETKIPSSVQYVLTAPEDDSGFGNYIIKGNLWVKVINFDVVKNEVQAKIQAKLNSFAAEKGYTNIETACSYLTSSIESFKSDAVICNALRDAVWVKYFAILANIENKKREEFSSLDDIIDELPEFKW